MTFTLFLKSWRVQQNEDISLTIIIAIILIHIIVHYVASAMQYYYLLQGNETTC